MEGRIVATPRTGRRTTKQRLAISAVFQDESSFMTAQQVFDALRDGDVSVGLATVYRNLQAMADDGELDAIRTPEGEMTYRRCSPTHHHHLVCSQCGTAVEIEADSTIEQWARNIATDHGFTLTGHDIELYGTCGKCTAKAQQTAHQE